MSEPGDEADDVHDSLTRSHAARFGSGLATVYDALDRLVTARDLDDAAVVVDVPPLGRQVLHAGRRPLGDDVHGLLTREPGLHVLPSSRGGDGERGDTDGVGVDPIIGELVVALAELALRHDSALLAIGDDRSAS